MSPVAADLLLHGIGSLYTCHREGDDAGPRRGAALADVGLVTQGAVAAAGERIVAVGPEDEVRRQIELLPGARLIDCQGAAVVPGFVDPHTHAVFARPRSDEFAQRLTGVGYKEIAAAGGGIRASVRDFRAMEEAQLLALTRRRLQAFLRNGTTTVEVKSGYGLDLESELKALRVVAALRQEVGMPHMVSTCLAAHEVPDEWQHDRDGFVELVCQEILPRVVDEGLAERADVFCEPGVFTVPQARQVLQRAVELGLRACVHADELDGSGGAELAAEVGADSADHLGRISPAGIQALGSSDTVAVLLPGTLFSLGSHDYAPARTLIEAGAAVALATDFNPGSNYCDSMPLTLAIACIHMGLSPREALTMATFNSAWALRRSDEVGSLVPGKRCDLAVLDAESIEELVHHLGGGPARICLLGGRVVSEWPEAASSSP